LAADEREPIKQTIESAAIQLSGGVIDKQHTLCTVRCCEDRFLPENQCCRDELLLTPGGHVFNFATIEAKAQIRAVRT
jgi:hypothetical protein